MFVDSMTNGQMCHHRILVTDFDSISFALTKLFLVCAEGCTAESPRAHGATDRAGCTTYSLGASGATTAV